MLNNPTIGFCIYCKSHDCDLTDEHVIPRSLCGEGHPDAILKKASCYDCKDITSKIELVIQKNLSDVRELLGLKTYKKGRKKKLQRTGFGAVFSKEKKIVVPIKDTMPSLIIPYPDFLPRLLSLEEHTPEHNKSNAWLHVLGGTPPDGFYSPTMSIKTDDYFKLYAKIAHAACHYLNPTQSFTPLLLNYIKGNENDSSLYIGRDQENEYQKQSFNPNILHKFKMNEVSVNSSIYIIIRLHLFSYYDAPEIMIIAGSKNK